MSGLANREPYNSPLLPGIKYQQIALGPGHISFSLSIGIMQMLIRYSAQTSKKIYSQIIHIFEINKQTVYNLANKYEMQDNIKTFYQIYTQMIDCEYEIFHRLQWLDYYAKNTQKNYVAALKNGMKLLIATILGGDDEVVMVILNDEEYGKSGHIFMEISRVFQIKVVVLENNQIKEYSYDIGMMPVMYMKCDVEESGLLYFQEMLEEAFEQNFDRNILEQQPFMSLHSLNQLPDSLGIGNRPAPISGYQVPSINSFSNDIPLVNKTALSFNINYQDKIQNNDSVLIKQAAKGNYSIQPIISNNHVLNINQIANIDKNNMQSNNPYTKNNIPISPPFPNYPTNNPPFPNYAPNNPPFPSNALVNNTLPLNNPCLSSSVPYISSNPPVLNSMQYKCPIPNDTQSNVPSNPHITKSIPIPINMPIPNKAPFLGQVSYIKQVPLFNNESLPSNPNTQNSDLAAGPNSSSYSNNDIKSIQNKDPFSIPLPQNILKDSHNLDPASLLSYNKLQLIPPAIGLNVYSEAQEEVQHPFLKDFNANFEAPLNPLSFYNGFPIKNDTKQNSLDINSPMLGDDPSPNIAEFPIPDFCSTSEIKQTSNDDSKGKLTNHSLMNAYPQLNSVKSGNSPPGIAKMTEKIVIPSRPHVDNAQGKIPIPQPRPLHFPNEKPHQLPLVPVDQSPQPQSKVFLSSNPIKSPPEPIPPLPDSLKMHEPKAEISQEKPSPVKLAFTGPPPPSLKAPLPIPNKGFDYKINPNCQPPPSLLPLKEQISHLKPLVGTFAQPPNDKDIRPPHDNNKGPVSLNYDNKEESLNQSSMKKLENYQNPGIPKVYEKDMVMNPFASNNTEKNNSFIRKEDFKEQNCHVAQDIVKKDSQGESLNNMQNTPLVRVLQPPKILESPFQTKKPIVPFAPRKQNQAGNPMELGFDRNLNQAPKILSPPYLGIEKDSGLKFSENSYKRSDLPCPSNLPNYNSLDVRGQIPILGHAPDERKNLPSFPLSSEIYSKASAFQNHPVSNSDREKNIPQSFEMAAKIPESQAASNKQPQPKIIIPPRLPVASPQKGQSLGLSINDPRISKIIPPPPVLKSELETEIRLPPPPPKSSNILKGFNESASIQKSEIPSKPSGPMPCPYNNPVPPRHENIRLQAPPPISGGYYESSNRNVPQFAPGPLANPQSKPQPSSYLPPFPPESQIQHSKYYEDQQKAENFHHKNQPPPEKMTQISQYKPYYDPKYPENSCQNEQKYYPRSERENCKNEGIKPNDQFRKIICFQCKTPKDREEFNVIICEKGRENCKICSFCRKNNNGYCSGCNRRYAGDELEILNTI